MDACRQVDECTRPVSDQAAELGVLVDGDGGGAVARVGRSEGQSLRPSPTEPSVAHSLTSGVDHRVAVVANIQRELRTRQIWVRE